MMSTQCLLAPTSDAANGDSDDSNSANERIEQLINKVQELKAELKEKDDNLALKSRLIEQVLQIGYSFFRFIFISFDFFHQIRKIKQLKNTMNIKPLIRRS